MMGRKNKGLTERHMKILHFLQDFQNQNGYPPSIREIGEQTGISSTSVVNYYLDQLEKLGYIKRDRHISRGVVATDKLAEAFGTAVQVVAEMLRIQVQGDSMIDAMVNDGDIVIIQPVTQVSNGEMVAVWLPEKDETTLKYFYKERNGYRLQPANPLMDPIMLSKTTPVEIKGKVVMVVRQVQSRL